MSTVVALLLALAPAQAPPPMPKIEVQPPDPYREIEAQRQLHEELERRKAMERRHQETRRVAGETVYWHYVLVIAAVILAGFAMMFVRRGRIAAVLSGPKPDKSPAGGGLMRRQGAAPTRPALPTPAALGERAYALARVGNQEGFRMLFPSGLECRAFMEEGAIAAYQSNLAGESDRVLRRLGDAMSGRAAIRLVGVEGAAPPDPRPGARVPGLALVLTDATLEQDTVALGTAVWTGESWRLLEG